jgi:hypothetical protein
MRRGWGFRFCHKRGRGKARGAPAMAGHSKARRSSHNPAPEATKRRIGGAGRGRGARGVSPRLQTGRGRLGGDNRRGGADDAPVVPCCGSMA